ncbi:TrmO family methyltransferase domain-containing protein [Streptacidiphilus fuscans]|uniref:SAM-dependent methyltransferase n=1 Tax=Streptacidiphilus fuscans TaxID=2789292 RepID=A0A931BAW9_9ACTN|nr:TrmO family methyltransferase [Streptacidiphilus fuscans]MBF9071877.1 SAM-dependent methyltransferase [Streptacidiphilus fuscans]
MPDPYLFEAVAHVINDRTEVSDDYWGGVPSIIRLREDLPENTLAGLNEFSHLQVVFKFHLAVPGDVHLGARSPRNDPRWEPSGTFAHRNHRRPAQIGVSHPCLIKIDGRDLHVVDLDAVDGTPVLDIAPWFADFGPRGEVHQPTWPSEMLANYWTEPA